MVSEHKKQELQALLSQLSEDQVSKLVTMMDAARSEESMAASSELIMSMLRPSLLHTKPRRIQTPQRILCDPFEDLLVPSRPSGKIDTKIPRSSIAPFWEWAQELGGTEFATTCQAFEDAVKRKDENAQWQASCKIWDEACLFLIPEIERAFSDGHYNAELGKRFKDADCVEDVREMLELIQVGEIVEALKKKLPAKPIMKMGDQHVSNVKKSYLEAAEKATGGEAWLLISVMRRLLHEAEILKVVKLLSRSGTDTLASMTDLSIVGDLVISEVEGYVTLASQIYEQKGRDLDVVELAQEYVGSFEEVTANLDIKREGEWGKRMLGTRKNMGHFITKAVLKDGIKCVMSGFSMTKRKLGNRISNVIDLRESPDIEKYRVSERRAKAIKESQLMADRMGLKSATQNVVTELVKELEQFEDKLIDILDRVAASEREIAKQHVIMTARLQELIIASDAADLFRQRALAILRRSGKKKSG